MGPKRKKHYPKWAQRDPKGSKKKKMNPSHEGFKPVSYEKYESENGNGKCPSWVFIILGVIAAFVALWLIYCIIQDKKKKPKLGFSF